MRKGISILVLSALSLSSANAALLTSIQGSVFLNRGEGFQPASGPAQIAPGSRVHAEQGSAEIVYENGCAVKVDAGQTVAVLFNPPSCQTGGISDSTLIYAGGALLVAGGVTAAVLSQNQKPASP